MITYQQEFLDSSKEESISLIEKHFDEVYPSRDTFQFDMDWDIYEKLEGVGLLKIFTARDDGNLAGYLWVTISPNLHSKGNLIATDDGFFLDKPYRGKSVAARLIKFTEKCLSEDGIKVLYLVGTKENPIDSFVNRLGYQEIETKFQKVL